MRSAGRADERSPSITTATDTAMLRVVMAAVEGMFCSILLSIRPWIIDVAHLE